MYLTNRTTILFFLLLSNLVGHTAGQVCTSEENDLADCQNAQTPETFAKCENCFIQVAVDLSSDSCEEAYEKYCMFRDCCGACSSEVKAYWECALSNQDTFAWSCTFDSVFTDLCEDFCPLKLRDLTDCQDRQTPGIAAECETCFNQVAVDFSSDSCKEANEKYCIFRDCCGACSSEVKAYWECEIKKATSTVYCEFDSSFGSSKCPNGSGALSSRLELPEMIVKLLAATMIMI